jgi:hypothetical protein
MNYDKIQKQLDDHLKTYAGLPTLQLENTQILAKTGKDFCRASLITPRPTRATLGLSGRDRLIGLYQIDLFTSLNTGSSTINVLADDLVAHFPRSLILSQDDCTVTMRMTWRETGARATQFYSAAVIVEWECVM